MDWNFYDKDGSKLKERFLEQYDEKTRKMYAYVLSKTTDAEKQLNKDVCNFTYDECDMMLYGLNATSDQSILTQTSILSMYVDYAILQGYVPTKINYFASSFTGVDVLKKYINKTAAEKKYITINELKEIIRFCENAQDYIPFPLLFFGVKGEKFEEILKLRVDNCNLEDGILKLTKNNGEQRTITVPELVTKAIDEAIKQDEYKKANGKMKEYNNVPTTVAIDKTNYVIRLIGRRAILKPSAQTINRRVATVSKWMGYNYLNPTNVWLSGMIHFAKEYAKEKNLTEFTVDDWETINKRFGYGKNSRQYASVTKNKIESYVFGDK